MYPLPLIQEIVSRWRGYKYFTKIDLSTIYYHFKLDNDSKALCNIVAPYSKFQYCRLSMCLKTSPDEAQAAIEEILQGIDLVAYIDDIRIFSDS